MNEKKNIIVDSDLGFKSKSIFLIAFLFGVLGILFYSINNFKFDGWTILANSFLIAGGTFFIGILLGFLFGIPRTLQGDTNTPNQEGDAKTNISYKVNTNLEQISDWLTKILVGVGLTQINKLPNLVSQIGNALSPGLGNQQSSKIYGVAVVIYYLVNGFLSGYLITRIFIGRIFRVADQTGLQKEIEELKNQSNFDAKALDVTTQLLSPGSESVKSTYMEIKDIIAKASPIARFTIFTQASKTRRETWNIEKKIMEKTIPIFRALIETASEQNHQYYGQLGYALKDQESPDWANAEDILSKAISIRGDKKYFGWTFYEFNRAICKIQKDENFQKGKESSIMVKNSIIEDLNAGKNEIFNFNKKISTDKIIQAWLALNKVV